MTNTDNNLIMGIANGYRFNDIKPFIISLRNTGYNGDIVLFAETTHPSIKQIASKYKIICVEYNNTYPFLFTINKNDPMLPETSSKNFHLFSYRHIIYYQYLNKHIKQYSHIMLTDVRDVVFQQNPFLEISNQGLNCFLEASEEKIKNDHAHNAAWVRNALGQEILDIIGDQTISCAGIIIGNSPSIIDYIKQMVSIIISYPNAAGPTDQGLHNYLIHTNKLKIMTLHRNGEGPVLTIGRIPHGTIKIDSRGNLLNNDGSIPNTLHQYDRHPDINQRIMAHYHSLPYRFSQLFKTIAKYKTNPRMMLGSIKVFIKYGL